MGLERTSNQDRALAILQGMSHAAPFVGRTYERDAEVVLAVCDGMGGAAGGEVASEQAVATMREALAAPVGADSTDATVTARRVVNALREAARTIQARAMREPRLRGMGTTATVAVVSADQAVLGQVGDSRAYLLRRGTLTQLTRDQSLAQLMIEQGRLRPEEVKEFVGANVILQAVGTSPHLDVDVRRVALTGGDVLLICSDGLCGLVGADALCDALARYDDPERACDELIRLALHAGGTDNVTCVVARVEGPSRDLETAPVAEHLVYEPEDPAEPPKTEPAAPLPRTGATSPTTPAFVQEAEAAEVGREAEPEPEPKPGRPGLLARWTPWLVRR
jgi:protein phosphatase